MHEEMSNLLATVGLHPGDASEGDQQPQTHDPADNIDGECLHKLPSNYNLTTNSIIPYDFCYNKFSLISLEFCLLEKFFISYLYFII